MSVHWVHTNTDRALEALEAVERALGESDADADESEAAGVAPADNERMLAENMAIAHEIWSVDTSQVINSSRPLVGKLITGFQRLVRRLTWWFALPQWLQISQFHAAAVRSISALAVRDQLFSDKLAKVDHLEQHVAQLQQEQVLLMQRLEQLENRLLELSVEREEAASSYAYAEEALMIERV